MQPRLSLSLRSRSALHLQHDVDKTTRRNKREANKKSVNKQRIGAGVSYVEYLLPSFHRQRLEYVVLKQEKRQIFYFWILNHKLLLPSHNAVHVFAAERELHVQCFGDYPQCIQGIFPSLRT